MAENKSVHIICVFSNQSCGRTTWLTTFVSAKIKFVYDYYASSENNKTILTEILKTKNILVINLDGVNYQQLHQTIKLTPRDLEMLRVQENKDISIKKVISKYNPAILDTIPNKYQQLTFRQILNKFKIDDKMRFQLNPDIFKNNKLVLFDGFDSVKQLELLKAHMDSLKINYKLSTIFVYTNPDVELTTVEEYNYDIIVANEYTIEKLKTFPQFEKIIPF